MIQIVHRQVVQFRLQILIVPQHQIVVRRVTQTQVIQQVVQPRHLSQTLHQIVNQSVNRFRRQDQIQHQ